jgi:NADPH:quinone reductase-like Zn-dependent oxidoreductase
MGHEGAGVVEEVGPEVTNHKVGDRAAWGWVNTPLLSFHLLQIQKFSAFTYSLGMKTES